VPSCVRLAITIIVECHLTHPFAPLKRQARKNRSRGYPQDARKEVMKAKEGLTLLMRTTFSS
jgi:hypothetical protein